MTDILDFISNTADGVVGVDRGQKVVLWNPAAEMLLGFKRREVLGRFWGGSVVRSSAAGTDRAPPCAIWAVRIW
jgi:PAS domain-containing protein